ncbi:transposase family protein [Corynebacterium durum]|uniref:transposase family protein n=1 Tax=Corynebacterium durum TaxID=61592 RepID=UPI0036F36C2D
MRLYSYIEIALSYLRENLTKRLLARLFGTSKPTISRAINTVLEALDYTLTPPTRARLSWPSSLRHRRRSPRDLLSVD